MLNFSNDQNNNNIVTGSLNALNAAVTLPISLGNGISFTIAAGTLAGVVSPEQSFDGGVTWSFGVWTVDPNTALYGQGYTFTNPNPSKSAILLAASGATHVRFRVSSFTSGTCDATISTSSLVGPHRILLATDSTPFLHAVQCDGNGNLVNSEIPGNLAVTATGTAGSAVTLTIPSVASQFHYISVLEITAYSTAARTGGATPVLVTTTNLPGSPVFTFGSGAAIGTTDTKLYGYPRNFKSSVAGTNTTIVCPATTSIIWRVNTVYYAAP